MRHTLQGAGGVSVRPNGQRTSDRMTTSYTALLRAVNLPAHGKIAMKDLTAAIADLGLQDVRSLLQSGNVVFRGDKRTPTDLERVLEKHVEKSLGLRTTFFVRTAEDLDDVIAHN